MPDIRMNDLDRQLRANKPSRVYFIYGSEAYLKRQAVEKLLGVCVQEETAGFNYQRFGAGQIKAVELSDATQQFPMMAERRCVLVEDYDFTKDFEHLCKSWIEAWTKNFDKLKLGQELDPVSGEPTKCSEWYSPTMIFYLYAAKYLDSKA